MKWEISCGTVRVSFDARPPAEVIAMLKSAGFRWNPPGKFWWRKKISGSGDFITALEKQVQRIADPNRPDGDCWRCGKPGKFRNYGAATPVYCDDCEHARRESEARSHPSHDNSSVEDRACGDWAYEDRCAEQCGL